MRIAIIQFPGSTCTRETSLAVARAGMIPVSFLWNESIADLETFAGYILVGGFSYEDRSRAGVIAALHPLIAVLKQQTEQGKPLLGICNGAQILVESGLVPGLADYQLAMALTTNKRTLNGKVLGTGFLNVWAQICLNKNYPQAAFTRKLKAQQSINIPIAHAEGRFKLSEELWTVLQEEGCTAFHYCDGQGQISENFPINPNGSLYNLAAISNARGNVLAMMPHPERSQEGDLIFQSMRDYIAEGNYPAHKAIPYYQAFYLPSIYRCPKQAQELIIAPLTTDNQALTVEKIILSQGIKISLKRYIHWEIHSSTDTLQQIMTSSILYNSNKEEWIKDPKASKSHIAFLVQAQEDLVGAHKKQQLEQSLKLEIAKLKHSILWLIDCDEENPEEVIDYLLRTSLLFNPHADKCVYYSFSRGQVF